MSEELALFDLSAPEPRRPASRPGRGRAREMWKRTVVADVEVMNARALCAAALRDFDERPSFVVARASTDGPDSRDEIRRDPIAALSWLVDPVDGLSPSVEAGACA